MVLAASQLLFSSQSVIKEDREREREWCLVYKSLRLTWLHFPTRKNGALILDFFGRIICHLLFEWTHQLAQKVQGWHSAFALDSSLSSEEKSFHYDDLIPAISSVDETQLDLWNRGDCVRTFSDMMTALTNKAKMLLSSSKFVAT